MKAKKIAIFGIVLVAFLSIGLMNISSVSAGGSYDNWYMFDSHDNKVYKFDENWDNPISVKDLSFLTTSSLKPHDFFLSNDGYWWIVLDNSNDDSTNVYQFDQDWNYTGNKHTKIETGSINDGYIHQDNENYWWVFNYDTSTIHKYDNNWNDTGENKSLGAPFVNTYDLHQGNTPDNWWLSGVDPEPNINGVREYDTVNDTYRTIDLSSEFSGGPGGFFQGSDNYWWRVDIGDDNVYKYTQDWTYTGTTYDVSTGGGGTTSTAIYQKTAESSTDTTDDTTDDDSGPIIDDDEDEDEEEENPIDWDNPEAREPGLLDIPKGLLIYPLFSIFGFTVEWWMVHVVLILGLWGNDRDNKGQDDKLAGGLFLVLLFLLWNFGKFLTDAGLTGG